MKSKDNKGGEKAKKDKKSQRAKWMQALMIVFFLLIGGICGFLMGGYIGELFADGSSAAETLPRALILFAGMYVAMFIQIVLHEGGHLVFGLLTGYRFASFRVGSFMWKKDGDKIRFCRMSLAGTGGQCLMAPPELVDGKIPYVLYNLGGSIVNLIAAILAGVFYLLCRPVQMLAVFFLMAAVIGVAFALMNGVPMRLGTVDNDGYNALSLGKNPEALRAFWFQMNVNEQISDGVRLKDMPDEWFEMPAQEAMKNSMVAAVGVLCCSRAMDAMELEKADSMMAELLAMETGMVDLHRRMLISERAYCELVAQNRRDVVDGLLDKDQKKFMKSMKNYPSILRTEYTYALLAEGDQEKAAKIRANFEKAAKTYPYPAEVEGERELMAYAEQRAEKSAG